MTLKKKKNTHQTPTTEYFQIKKINGTKDQNPTREIEIKNKNKNKKENEKGGLAKYLGMNF